MKKDTLKTPLTSFSLLASVTCNFYPAIIKWIKLKGYKNTVDECEMIAWEMFNLNYNLIKTTNGDLTNQMPMIFVNRKWCDHITRLFKHSAASIVATESSERAPFHWSAFPSFSSMWHTNLSTFNITMIFDFLIHSVLSTDVHHRNV